MRDALGIRVARWELAEQTSRPRTAGNGKCALQGTGSPYAHQHPDGDVESDGDVSNVPRGLEVYREAQQHHYHFAGKKGQNLQHDNGAAVRKHSRHVRLAHAEHLHADE